MLHAAKTRAKSGVIYMLTFPSGKSYIGLTGKKPQGGQSEGNRQLRGKRAP